MQNLINQINNISKINSGKEYNLGNLIEDLEKYKETFKLVEFDNGKIPTDFSSWRGNYCELALEYKDEGECYS